MITLKDLKGFPQQWDASSDEALAAHGIFPNHLFFKRTKIAALQCRQGQKGDYQLGVNGLRWLMRAIEKEEFENTIVVAYNHDDTVENFMDAKQVWDGINHVTPHRGEGYSMHRTMTGGVGTAPYNDYWWVNRLFDPVDQSLTKFVTPIFDPRSKRRSGTFS